MNQPRPKVAFIGTGGTIASLGTGPLDTVDYGVNQTICTPELAACVPEFGPVAEALPVQLRNVTNYRVFFGTGAKPRDGRLRRR